MADFFTDLAGALAAVFVAGFATDFLVGAGVFFADLAGAAFFAADLTAAFLAGTAFLAGAAFLAAAFAALGFR